MVKGNSKQVIVVHPTDQTMFEQAIFILKDNAVGKDGVTDEALLREAKQLIREPTCRKHRWLNAGPVWACGGAAVTGFLWLALSIW